MLSWTPIRFQDALFFARDEDAGSKLKDLFMVHANEVFPYVMRCSEGVGYGARNQYHDIVTDILYFKDSRFIGGESFIWVPHDNVRENTMLNSSMLRIFKSINTKLKNK